MGRIISAIDTAVFLGVIYAGATCFKTMTVAAALLTHAADQIAAIN